MTFLFRQGTLSEKIRGILIATMTHAKNLAHFTLIYKTVIYLIRLVVREIKQHHTIFAAFLGGYYVFGKKNSINEQVCCIFLFRQDKKLKNYYDFFWQINMYLLSRTLFGLARVAQEKGLVPEVVTKHQVFSWFSAIVWGTALWLFEYHIHTLQPGLQSSMTYLYHDSQKWDSFKNFLIYNK